MLFVELNIFMFFILILGSFCVLFVLSLLRLNFFGKVICVVLVIVNEFKCCLILIRIVMVLVMLVLWIKFLLLLVY